MADPQIVYVIDDDASIRSALKRFFSSAGYGCRTYATVPSFVGECPHDAAGCLVLDIQLPGPSGLDLQAQLKDLECSLPIIFLTAHADVKTTVRAMKAGALEFLTKPARIEDLLDAVRRAFAVNTEARRRAADLAALRNRYEELTPRERQVMGLVVGGLLNKQIAAELSIAEKTVKVHRASVMKSMKAGSLAGLVRMAEQLQVAPQPVTVAASAPPTH
jgi:FixJ family two-component response regulator